MSINQTFNGVVYPIPTQSDLRWAPPLDRYLIALGTFALAPSGGTFTLTNEVNFGTSFGLLAPYYKSSASNPAGAGLLRLTHVEAVNWRNNANSGNLALAVNGSDQLTFNGSTLNTLSIPVTVPNGGTGLTSTTAYAVLVGGTSSTGALQTPGTGSSGQVLTSQGPGVLPIWSAAGTGSGTVNTGVSNTLAYYASTTNAVSTLTAITASRALASDANGLPVAATTTATELGYVSGVTSAIQTQINSKGSGTVTSVSGTSNQIGSTGGATPVLSLSSTLVVPGTATITGALTLSSTVNSNIVFDNSSTHGIAGTTTNNSAAAGNVGEYVSATFSAVSVATSGQWGDMTSMSLTAGDWQVMGNVDINRNGATVTGSQLLIGGTSSGNTTTGTSAGNGQTIIANPIAGITDGGGALSGFRLLLASTTTVYMKVNLQYSAATPQGTGIFAARRMR